MDHQSPNMVVPERAPAGVVWFVALVAMLPWLLALGHLAELPAEAARQDLADGHWWPGLGGALILGGVAVGLAAIASRVVAQRAPHLVASILVILAFVMGWVVRPLAWRHAPADLFAIERGKIWVVYLVLSVLGIILVAGVGLQRRGSSLKVPQR